MVNCAVCSKECLRSLAARFYSVDAYCFIWCRTSLIIRRRRSLRFETAGRGNKLSPPYILHGTVKKSEEFLHSMPGVFIDALVVPLSSLMLLLLLLLTLTAAPHVVVGVVTRNCRTQSTARLPKKICLRSSHAFFPLPGFPPLKQASLPGDFNHTPTSLHSAFEAVQSLVHFAASKDQLCPDSSTRQ